MSLEQKVEDLSTAVNHLTVVVKGLIDAVSVTEASPMVEFVKQPPTEVTIPTTVAVVPVPPAAVVPVPPAAVVPVPPAAGNIAAPPAGGVVPPPPAAVVPVPPVEGETKGRKITADRAAKLSDLMVQTCKNLGEKESVIAALQSFGVGGTGDLTKVQADAFQKKLEAM